MKYIIKILSVILTVHLYKPVFIFTFNIFLTLLVPQHFLRSEEW